MGAETCAVPLSHSGGRVQKKKKKSIFRPHGKCAQPTAWTLKQATRDSMTIADLRAFWKESLLLVLSWLCQPGVNVLLPCVGNTKRKSRPQFNIQYGTELNGLC